MSIKLLNAKIRKEILKKKSILDTPKGKVEIRHYDDRPENPDPHMLYIYTNKAIII